MIRRKLPTTLSVGVFVETFGLQGGDVFILLAIVFISSQSLLAIDVQLKFIDMEPSMFRDLFFGRGGVHHSYELVETRKFMNMTPLGGLQFMNKLCATQQNTSCRLVY